MVDTETLSVDDAARLSGMTSSYVRRLAREGKLSAVRVGRQWHIPAHAMSVLTDRDADEAGPTWELERSLLYAERAELRMKLLEQRVDQLQSSEQRLTAENRRLRAALIALAAAPVSDTTV